MPKIPETPQIQHNTNNAEQSSASKQDYLHQLESCFPLSEIEHVEFFILGEEEYKKNSAVVIRNKELFKDGNPIEAGIYSLKMGTTDFSLTCRTCLNTRNNCPGHFGSIQLSYPVQSPLFRGEIMRWLKIVCHQCGTLIVNVTDNTFKTATKDIVCKNCGFIQPHILKDPRDCIKIIANRTNESEYRIYNDDIETIFSRITPETIKMIGKSINYHPSKFLLRTIPALPNADRPDVRKIKSGGGRSNNNDNTTLLKNIVTRNEQIQFIIDDESRKKNESALDLIELTYYSMVKEVPAGNTSSKLIGGTGQPMTSISNRINGKGGRIRDNLEGKRIQFAARSVITGDSNIMIDEIGVPISIARTLQIPEIVRPYNIDRLMTYFLNKEDTYPGCVKIVKGDNGATYYTGSIQSNIQLEYGDTIYRDMIDGDNVAMNRQPSLLYSAISGHRAKILHGGDTFHISVNVADTLYGGDFDGDTMVMYPSHCIVARNECAMLSNLKRWFISYKDKSPSMGVYHDNMIGIFELTKETTKLNQFSAMQLMSQVDDDAFLHKGMDVSEVNIGRDLISLLLPEINYTKKSAFYKPEYSGFINYNPKETHVDIKRGKVISGRFDKKSVGQGVNDSIFHTVFNEYGCDVAISLIHNIQQITTSYLLARGYTINYDDIAIRKDILQKINDITAGILAESARLTKKLRSGMLTAPIGMSINDFYEQEQISILSPGDEFTEVVMSSLDHENNNLYKLVASGAKGKPTNILQICSSIGQMSISGRRMQKTFGFERATPYFNRFHDDPQAVGFIPDSFVTGVSSLSAIAQQQDGRFGIITKAMSTSITGAHNRKCGKVLEAIVIDNLRSAVKGKNILQPLYGDDGCDIRRVAYADFSILLASDATFKEKLTVDITKLPSKYNNKKVQDIISNEYARLLADRDQYRTGFLKIERYNVKDKLVSSSQEIPININRIFELIIYKFTSTDARGKDTSEGPLSPIEWQSQISELKKRLKYCHYNEQQYHRNMPIPEYISKSFTLINISIDITLNLRRIIDNNVNSKMMTLITNKICYTFKESLIEYGTPIGTITSECTSESMTQRILDSIHSSGVSKGNFLTRIGEVYGAKNTKKLSNPYMDIYVLPEYENDITKLQELANDIEMMNFKKFITRTQIFFENYKQVIHPNYKDENVNLIQMHEKHNPKQKIPSDLIKWCIRLELSHEILLEKNVSLRSIYIKLKEVYPMLHIVHTDENTVNIIMRIYIRKPLLKRIQYIDHNVINTFLTESLLKTIIRGVDGVISANVMQDYVARSYIDTDGSVKNKKISIIRTSGTNLGDIVDNPMIDPIHTTSNSIMEIAELYGIDAARQKLIIELRNMISDPDYKHYMLIADELTFTGVLTSIEKVGLDIRNINTNSLLCISASHPMQKVVDAAINNRKSVTHESLSSSLLIGSTPNYCANYNNVIMNEQFLADRIVNVSNVIDEL